jgi:hypothetical protein
VKHALEAEEKVVLFGWHRDVYDIWLDRLADFNPVLYTGSESANQKDGARRRAFWTATPRPDHVAALRRRPRRAAGADARRVFGELDWSPGMHDQCIGRLHRDGQDESVVAYFLVSDVGTDPLMAEVLNLKRMQSEPLRDPDAPLFEAQESNQDRVRKLAEQVLARRKVTRAAA